MMLLVEDSFGFIHSIVSCLDMLSICMSPCSGSNLEVSAADGLLGKAGPGGRTFHETNPNAAAVPTPHNAAAVEIEAQDTNTEMLAPLLIETPSL